MIQFNDKLEVTDHDLSQMANRWAKLLPNEDIGIRTAFAHGFKAALSEVKKLNKSDVIKSVCLLGYSFEGCTYVEPKHEACKYCDKFRQTVL